MRCVVTMTVMIENGERSWELPIDTGEVPQNESTFDAIVVGGGPGVLLLQAILLKQAPKFCSLKRQFGREIKSVVML